jgi:hypothetical protein
MIHSILAKHAAMSNTSLPSVIERNPRILLQADMALLMRQRGGPAQRNGADELQQPVQASLHSCMP